MYYNVAKLQWTFSIQGVYKRHSLWQLWHTHQPRENVPQSPVQTASHRFEVTCRVQPGHRTIHTPFEGVPVAPCCSPVGRLALVRLLLAHHQCVSCHRNMSKSLLAAFTSFTAVYLLAHILQVTPAVRKMPQSWVLTERGLTWDHLWCNFKLIAFWQRGFHWTEDSKGAFSVEEL